MLRYINCPVVKFVNPGASDTQWPAFSGKNWVNGTLHCGPGATKQRIMGILCSAR